MMNREQFIQRVQWVGHFDSRRQAEKSIRAVLEALARRLTEKEAGHLWHALPPGIEVSVKHERGHEKFGLDEFLDVVAENESTPFQDALHHAHAVLGVLQENLPEKELKEMLSTLPQDYADFFMRARELALSTK
jgi:uncharacterized protein (DUF2267 family)